MIKQTLFLLLLASCIIFSQEMGKDSIYEGRKCIIILFNTFEAEGTITAIAGDTITFDTYFGVYKIPRNQVKSVNRWEEAEEELALLRIADTTDYCDVYLEGGKKLVNIKLTKNSDSAIGILKWKKLKAYNIADIRKLEFTGAGFGRGLLIGGGIGFAMGLAFMLALPEHGEYHRPDFGGVLGFSFLCAIPSGLIGGIMGAIFKKDEIYLFPTGYSNTKAKRIKYIIEKHKQ